GGPHHRRGAGLGRHRLLDRGRAMKLGFLTARPPTRPLGAIAPWASSHGYEALEVAAWPALGDRPFTATHLDAESYDRDQVLNLFAEHGLTLSSLAFYDNNLHPDPKSTP